MLKITNTNTSVQMPTPWDEVLSARKGRDVPTDFLDKHAREPFEG